MAEITNEAFSAWAESVGITASEGHLERLRVEVQGMFGRLAHLDEIDLSEVAMEEAGLRVDSGEQPAGGAA